VVWAGAPYAVDCLFKIEPEFHAACLRAIRISAVILAIRSIESVFVGALRAFERVNIPAGQTKHVKFTLNPRDLSCVDPDGVTHVAAGAYQVWVGGGQPSTKAPGQQVALTIQGEQKLPR